MRVIWAMIALALISIAPARAEVAASGPTGFVLRAEAQTSASPERTWSALLRIQDWWNGTHTYSGDARRLRLEPRAGGCWCERWGEGQSVEHARVVLLMEQEGVRTLRVVGGLGPLQALGATGVLTFTVSPNTNGASVAMSYRVSGEPGLGLETMAPLVDQVLMEQFGRLIRYSDTGSPD